MKGRQKEGEGQLKGMGRKGKLREGKEREGSGGRALCPLPSSAGEHRRSYGNQSIDEMPCD